MHTTCMQKPFLEHWQLDMEQAKENNFSQRIYPPPIKLAPHGSQSKPVMYWHWQQRVAEPNNRGMLGNP